MNKSTLKCPNCGAVGSSESKGSFYLKNSNKVAYRLNCACGHKYLIYENPPLQGFLFAKMVKLTESEYLRLKNGGFLKGDTAYVVNETAFWRPKN